MNESFEKYWDHPFIDQILDILWGSLISYDLFNKQNQNNVPISAQIRKVLSAAKTLLKIFSPKYYILIALDQ